VYQILIIRFFINYIFIVYVFDAVIFCDSLYIFFIYDFTFQENWNMIWKGVLYS
jgi:hypothetical protein